MFQSYLILMAIILAIEAASIPNYIKVCHKSNKDLNACALKSANEALPTIIKGDKKYKVPSLLPLKVPKISVEENQLSILLKDAEVNGFDTATVKDIQIDLLNNQWKIVCHAEYVNLWSDYEMKGQLLVLAIEGVGKANITLNGITITYTFKYELEKMKDGNHAKIIDSNIEYKNDLIRSHLTNLFGGDKMLGDQINKFLNENWKELEKELAPAISKVMNSLITNVAKNLFTIVPYDEILPD